MTATEPREADIDTVLEPETATPPVMTLEQLRDYAREHCDASFDLSSPCGCLASTYHGKTMYGHWQFKNGDRVPREFGDFTEAACAGCRVDAGHEPVYSGGDIADALDMITSGRTDPHSAGRNLLHYAYPAVGRMLTDGD
jgi:hypothetical protein